MAYDYTQDPRYQGLVEHFRSKGFAGHPRFYELLAQIACTHADKNRDYSGDDDPLGNLRECEGYGISAVDGLVARLTDKDSRFKHWLRRRRRSTREALLRVKDEPIADTLQDRAVYTLLLLILLEEEEVVSPSPEKTGTITLRPLNLRLDNVALDDYTRGETEMKTERDLAERLEDYLR